MYIEPVPNFYVGEEELTRLGISREKKSCFLAEPYRTPSMVRCILYHSMMRLMTVTLLSA